MWHSGTALEVLHFYKNGCQEERTQQLGINNTAAGKAEGLPPVNACVMPYIAAS